MRRDQLLQRPAPLVLNDFGIIPLHFRADPSGAMKPEI